MTNKRFVIVSLLLVFITCACTPPKAPEVPAKPAEEEAFTRHGHNGLSRYAGRRHGVPQFL
jgi:hypothetical protein